MFNITETSGLWAKQENFKHIVLASINSTNNYAKENLISFNQSPYLIFTNEQTAGRGRRGNTWASPKKGTGLLCSFVFKIKTPPQPIAAPCFGWAVYKSLNETFDANFNIKAPNDIYINDSKVGGLLLESVSKGDQHHLILGLGLNVFSHPCVDNSNSILNSIKNHEIKKTQWTQFLSHLILLSSQAAITAQDSKISKATLNELKLALKKYPKNKIKTLLANGSLKLNDGTTTNWRDL